MAKQGQQAEHIEGARGKPSRAEATTARQALDRATLDAIVTLFLLRDGNVLPDELASEREGVEQDAERQLLTYAELSGLLKAEVAAKASLRIGTQVE